MAVCFFVWLLMMFVFSLKYRFSIVWRFCETSAPNFVFVCIYLLSTVCKCYIENVHISHTYREIRCEILASVISGEMLDDTNIKCIDTMEYEYEHIYSYYYYAFVVWLSLLWRASLSPSVCECVSYTILDFSFFFLLFTNNWTCCYHWILNILCSQAVFG